jgi:hypothetical protein
MGPAAEEAALAVNGQERVIAAAPRRGRTNSGRHDQGGYDGLRITPCESAISVSAPRSAIQGSRWS